MSIKQAAVDIADRARKYHKETGRARLPVSLT